MIKATIRMPELPGTLVEGAKVPSTVDAMMRRRMETQDVESITVEVKDSIAIELKNPAIPVDEQIARQKIADALRNVPQTVRERVIRNLRTKFDDDIRKLESSSAQKRARAAMFEQHLVALEALKDWDPAIVLERNDCSRLHKVKECLREQEGLNDPDIFDAVIKDRLMRCENTFVIQHDWAGAFEGAEDLDGEDLKLPYENCVFEFRIGGRTVMLFFSEIEGPLYSSCIIECGETWISPPNEPGTGRQLDDAWYLFLKKQVRAVCIALDAEVAVTRVERAPAALNRKREKAGKLPLPAYSVVDLSKRHRVGNPMRSGEPTGMKKRMHFRRGHWRHYETHRTWIKWMLVGNPDLGFIQKHYRL